MDTAFIHREQGRMLQELNDFLSIPSVSALPAHAADCRRAAEWLQRQLTGLDIRWCGLKDRRFPGSRPS
jgi:acetylornithine deacetylase/succinyl-diaminopimelate desuccinylase-like protein